MKQDRAEESSKSPLEHSERDDPRWVVELEGLYKEVDAEIDPHQDLCKLRGVCCDFRVAEHTLFATEIEVRYARFALARQSLRGDSEVFQPSEVAGAELPAAEAPGLCPFWKRGVCHARGHRPLGCRTYFCDPSWRQRGEDIHARFHRKLSELHARHEMPYSYAPWVEALAESSPAMPPGRA